MNTGITEYLIFQNRHPERSEAKDVFSSQRVRPSAVEGPSRFNPEVTATNLCHFMQGNSRCLCPTAPTGMTTRFAQLSRSFDFGSATRYDKANFPFAFAQDDGAFIFTFDSEVNP